MNIHKNARRKLSSRLRLDESTVAYEQTSGNFEAASGARWLSLWLRRTKCYHIGGPVGGCLSQLKWTVHNVQGGGQK